MVQLGNIPGPPMTKDLDLRGSFRFNQVFGQALAALAGRRIVVESRLTARSPLAHAKEAVEPALGRNQAMKGQLFAEA